MSRYWLQIQTFVSKDIWLSSEKTAMYGTVLHNDIKTSLYENHLLDSPFLNFSRILKLDYTSDTFAEIIKLNTSMWGHD